MQPETPTGETPVVTDPKTNPNPAVTPPVEKTPDPEVERFRKEAEQATMRANQLANELKTKTDAEEAAKTKQLEEQNKFKDLYEQEKTRREEIETAQEKAERETAIKTESDKLFAEYPAEVKTLAQEVGLSLTDTDEDTTAAFKAKLEKISGSIKAPKVTPNNPGVPTPSTELTNQQVHEMLSDPAKFQEYVQKNLKGVSSMAGKSS